MRLRQMKIQWLMVAIIFLAVFLWSGPILVPEAIRRWRVCDGKAADYLAEARAYSVDAKWFAARSQPRAAALVQERADECVTKSQIYRRARWIPWEFWSLGDN